MNNVLSLTSKSIVANTLPSSLKLTKSYVRAIACQESFDEENCSTAESGSPPARPLNQT
jgi:hypothetical protein